MKTKFITLLMVVCMIFTYMPSIAFAEDSVSTESSATNEVSEVQDATEQL